jgi:hypothetical protein
MSTTTTSMKTKDKVVLVGTLVWFVLLWTMFPHANLGFIFTLAALCGGLVWFALTFGKRAGNAALPAGFKTSYRSRPIAMDLENGTLWVRPTRGRDRVLHKGQLRQWKHEWTESHNVVGTTFRQHNRITFAVADLNEPMFDVSFKSYQEAAIWHARLSAWINE